MATTPVMIKIKIKTAMMEMGTNQAVASRNDLPWLP
jgi:hypothetical protein